MEEYKNVNSFDEPKEIEVGKTKTLVRSNIHQEEVLFGEKDGVEEYQTLWVYDEIKYTNQEYMDIMANEMAVMKKIIDFYATVINIE